MSNPHAAIGKWYQEVHEGLVFEVVAVDEDEGLIELQHIDGEINEFEIEDWDELVLEQVSAPEDWRNTYGLSSEDRLDSDGPGKPGSSTHPIDGIEPQITMGLLDD